MELPTRGAMRPSRNCVVPCSTLTHSFMSIDYGHSCPGPGAAFGRVASRRDFLRHAGGGFGLLALTSLLDKAGLLVAAESTAVNPLAPKAPHMAARAKNVIFLFMSGGPSHVD